MSGPSSFQFEWNNGLVGAEDATASWALDSYEGTVIVQEYLTEYEKKRIFPMPVFYILSDLAASSKSISTRCLWNAK